MKRKFGLAVIVLLAATLALVGAFREVNTTKAGAPLPLKPVFPGTATGGMQNHGSRPTRLVLQRRFQRAWKTERVWNQLGLRLARKPRHQHR